MDEESHASLKEIDALFHWIYREGKTPCRLEVKLVDRRKLEKESYVFRIRTQCDFVSVHAQGLLDFKARVGEFANSFRVPRQLALPELPGGVTNIIERYADAWGLQYPQFRALIETAFHARNVTGPDSDIDEQYLGYLTMREIGECLCFRFGLEDQPLLRAGSLGIHHIVQNGHRIMC